MAGSTLACTRLARSYIYTPVRTSALSLKIQTTPFARSPCTHLIFSSSHIRHTLCRAALSSVAFTLLNNGQRTRSHPQPSNEPSLPWSTSQLSSSPWWPYLPPPCTRPLARSRSASRRPSPTPRKNGRRPVCVPPASPLAFDSANTQMPPQDTAGGAQQCNSVAVTAFGTLLAAAGSVPPRPRVSSASN